MFRIVSVVAVLAILSVSHADDSPKTTKPKSPVGMWSSVSVEDGGGVKEYDGLTLEITDKELRYTNGVGKKVIQVTKLDTTANPPVILGVDETGKKRAASFEVKGDTLRLVFAFEGDTPPRKAAVGKGTELLMTYKRVTK